MTLGIGNNFGFGSSNAPDHTDFGLGLLNSASGAETDDLNTPDLSLSKLGTGFDQQIQDAINSMNLKNQVQTQVPGQLVTPSVASPSSQQITSALSAIDSKQVLSDDKVKEMAAQFEAFGLQAVSAPASGGLQNQISLQESLVGLQRLAEDYGSKEAAASLAGLFSRLDATNPTKKYLEQTFEKWGRIDFFSFKSLTVKGQMSDESKRSKTRSIQYMLFVSLQVNLNEHDPMLQTLRECPYVHEACQQNSPKFDRTAASVSDSPLAASEKQAVPIKQIDS